MTVERRAGSCSIEQPDYWWYRARDELLRTVFAGELGRVERLLDVGSADGPSVSWMRGAHQHVAVDLDPRGLRPGEGVRASAIALPFPDGTFDVVAAFDVIEHCEPEDLAVSELERVLRPGGRLLVSVPAYQWAWSDHDVRAGHQRRYTRRRIVAAAERAGLRIGRATYGFTLVFPFFVAERLKRRVARVHDEGLPTMPRALERLLLLLVAGDARLLRRRDLPFGSSVFLAAQKPEVARP
ncbi:MAG TPA: class I SAM-dependent methyltransferase [Nocardioidaceae bacterium]